MKYRLSCHCGKLAYEVDGEITGAMACNCSICSRKGSLLWFVPRASMKPLTDQKEIATYHFNKHAIDHRFCRVCGIQPFANGKDPQGNDMAAINLRCIENLDLASIAVTKFDGRSV